MQAISLRLPLVVFLLFAVSCSNSREPNSRREQEKMFRELFGFAPPQTVREIRYKDVSNRYLLDGAWGRWMAFTYTPEVFVKVLAKRLHAVMNFEDVAAMHIDSIAPPAHFGRYSSD